MEIIKDNAKEAWIEALKRISKQGMAVENDGQETKEILNLMITIRDPSEGITRPIEVLRGFKEWSYPELDELEDVISRKDASTTYQYTYGARIFNVAGSKDQVEEYIIPLLQKNPNTRRALIVLYHPLIDSKLSNKESPCLISMHFKIMEGKLTLTAILRSNEMFIGWPANIYQLSLIQKQVARSLGADVGSLTTISHSGHVYKEFDEEISEVVKNNP
ncbi:hypothetical protein JW826_02595 [Candidatus Woesearchaeota archaeon]|nr:hypothetical protein [Candidatus Woesearchaeota archaeon]